MVLCGYYVQIELLIVLCEFYEQGMIGIVVRYGGILGPWGSTLVKTRYSTITTVTKFYINGHNMAVNIRPLFCESYSLPICVWLA